MTTEAVSPFRQAGLELASIRGQILAFKREKMIVLNGVQVFRVSELTSNTREKLDSELWELIREHDRAWKLHQALMKEAAEQKLGGAA